MHLWKLIIAIAVVDCCKVLEKRISVEKLTIHVDKIEIHNSKQMLQNTLANI